VLRLLSAHIQGIVFELDADARFVRVWSSDSQLLAFPPEQLLGRTLLETLGPELGRIHHDAVRATLDSGQPATYEYELDVAGGHRHFACESVAVSGSRGKQRNAIFWIRDITEQVSLRKRLLESERLASVATIAAGLAHEINNPLAYMLLNAEQMRAALRRPADATLEERLAPLRCSVEMIFEGTRHVQRIIRELRQLARPPGRIEPIDVRQVIDVSVELTRSLWESRARLTAECESVPPVLAHRGCLVQVFTNLIANAAEAIGPSSPCDNEIAISVCQRELNKVQIEVRDSGAGIAPKDTQRVFEPFFTTKEHGTGLGLPLCQMIVSALEGEIVVESGLARGSAFKVLLPAAAS
jgi:PAS domain S-box-containing protein